MSDRRNKRGSKKNGKAKLQERFEREELRMAEQDEAMSVVLPYAKDTVPFARKDLSVPITRLLKSWTTRSTNVCLFKENYSYTSLGQTLTNSFSALSFQLGFLGNVSGYQVLFDQYRIRCVVVTITPAVTANLTTPSTNYLPRLFTVIDYDDDSLPPTLTAMQQYDTLMISPPCTSVTRIIAPRVATQLYGGVSTTGYEPKENAWIDMSNVSVPHYGLKIGIEPANSGQTVQQRYTIEACFFFECRSQR